MRFGPTDGTNGVGRGIAVVAVADGVGDGDGDRGVAGGDAMVLRGGAAGTAGGSANEVVEGDLAPTKNPSYGSERRIGQAFPRGRSRPPTT
jgi:hypothetical protein